MTQIFRPAYVVTELGELGLLPDGSIINVGGVAGPDFTVGGRGLLFADGGSTDGLEVEAFSLQGAYTSSGSPAVINLVAGKDLSILSGTTGITVHAATGNVTINGLLNGLSISDIIDHLTPGTAKHAADEISLDDTGFINIAGANLQAALESIDGQLSTINASSVSGFEYIQLLPAVVWTIPHNENSDKVQVTVWDEENSIILPDAVTILDGNTVYVAFASPQAGRAILMIFQ